VKANERMLVAVHRIKVMNLGGSAKTKEIPEEVVPDARLIGFFSVGMIGGLVQPIQNGADSVGVSVSTLMCLSLNFQNTFPLKK